MVLYYQKSRVENQGPGVLDDLRDVGVLVVVLFCLLVANPQDERLMSIYHFAQMQGALPRIHTFFAKRFKRIASRTVGS